MPIGLSQACCMISWSSQMVERTEAPLCYDGRQSLTEVCFCRNPVAYALGFLSCDDISARCMLSIFQFFATNTDASALRMLNGSPADRLLKPITDYIESKYGTLQSISCRLVCSRQVRHERVDNVRWRTWHSGPLKAFPDVIKIIPNLTSGCTITPAAALHFMYMVQFRRKPVLIK